MKYYSQIAETDKKKIKEYELPFIIMYGTVDEDHFKGANWHKDSSTRDNIKGVFFASERI